MKRKSKVCFWIAGGLLAAFVVWTVLVRFVDVRAIGPEGSKVGFATLNGFVHRLTGENLFLYDLTDLLSIIPLGFVAGFGILGLVQWIKRKKLLSVDYSILVLGGFYIVVMALYLMFEVVVINYRPLLIEGVLEVSYPSSTTMLVLCVMPTAAIQLGSRIKKALPKYLVIAAIVLFTAFMVVGRLISGVHWFSDIIGGLFLSSGLVMTYCAVCGLKDK